MNTLLPATINVIPPPSLAPTLVYDEGNSTVAFTQPVIDSTGALYVARSATGNGCPSGVCNHYLQKIVPGNPSGGWTSTALSSDSITSLRRFVAPGNRVYVEGDRNTLWAFEADGTPSIGWPVHFPPSSYSNGGINTAFTETFLDSTTGEVFGALTPIGASNPDPPFFLALRADGTEMWHLADPEVASFYLGPERDLYDLSFDRFARFDRETGGVDSSGTAQPKCQTPLTFQIYNGTTGNQTGIFSAFRSTLTEYDAACAALPVFFTPPDRANLSVWTIVSGMVLATDEPATGVTAPTDRQLVGISPDGSVLAWRNTQFGPDLSGTTAQPVRATFGATALVLGIDGSDSNKRKLYLVNVFSGALMAQPLDLTSLCASCGVAVDTSGNVYVNDMNSTKIWSIPWPIR